MSGAVWNVRETLTIVQKWQSCAYNESDLSCILFTSLASELNAIFSSDLHPLESIVCDEFYFQDKRKMSTLPSKSSVLCSLQQSCGLWQQFPISDSHHIRDSIKHKLHGQREFIGWWCNSLQCRGPGESFNLWWYSLYDCGIILTFEIQLMS